MPRSKESKRLIFILFISLVFLMIGSQLILRYNIRRVNLRLTAQNQAMIGAVLTKYPELENDIVPIITKEYTTEDRIKGEQILDKYQYNEWMDQKNQILLAGILKDMSTEFLVFTAGLAFVAALFGYVQYRSVTKKIERVYVASEKVVNGDFSMQLREEGEGSISILNHQFNKMARIIQLNYEHLNREKLFLRDTISDISHQLKTPLASLIMFNDLMMDDEEMDPETRKIFLEKSRNQYDRMQWLIINLLKIARIEAGAISFREETVPVMQLIEVSRMAVESLLFQKNQQIVVTGDTQASYIGDFHWTEEAIANIFKNATEHAEPSSTIEVELEESTVFTKIMIRNHGPLVSPEDLPHIFQRFYKSVHNANSDSVGIGLNLSKTIIEGQGGIISAKNLFDGVEFTITFFRKDMGHGSTASKKPLEDL